MASSAADAAGAARPTLLVWTLTDDAPADATAPLVEGGYLCVETARDRAHLIERLLDESAPSVAAVLLVEPSIGPDFLDLCDQLHRLAVRRAPQLLAARRTWSQADGALASRAGVDGFLARPLVLSNLLDDMMRLRSGRPAASAERLIMAAGTGTDAPGWRGDMARLALQVPRDAVRRDAREQRLLDLLDAAADQALGCAEAEALLAYTRRDREQLRQLLREHAHLPLLQVERLHAALEDRLMPRDALAADARVLRSLEGVVELVRARDRVRTRSARLDGLQARAVTMLTSGTAIVRDPESVEARAFRVELAEALGADPPTLFALRGPPLARIASRFVKMADAEQALDLARLSLLAYHLKAERDAIAARNRSDCGALKAMTDLFAGADEIGDAVLERLQALRAHAPGLLSGADGLPPLETFLAHFREVMPTLDPGEMQQAGLTLPMLQASVDALERASASASAPTPAPAATPTPAPAPAPRPASAPSAAAQPSPRAAALERLSSETGALLRRLARELELPEASLDVLDTPGLLARLPRHALDDLGLGTGQAARARFTGLLIHEAPPELASQLQRAYARSHAHVPGMIEALARTLKAIG